ncbi:unnamed protein product, partial [Tilletia controversa]
DAGERPTPALSGPSTAIGSQQLSGSNTTPTALTPTSWALQSSLPVENPTLAPSSYFSYAMTAPKGESKPGSAQSYALFTSAATVQDPLTAAPNSFSRPLGFA